MSKHLLIVGGGFAGLWSALAAAREAEIAGGDIVITLASRDDHLTLRPRLYEQNPARFREPLRPILETVGVSLHLGSVCGIDVASRKVALDYANGKSASVNIKSS